MRRSFQGIGHMQKLEGVAMIAGFIGAQALAIATILIR
jgi:hypothetical protein